MRTVLVTGGAGFLGKSCARHFQIAGWRVVGLGHGRLTKNESLEAGYHYWINSAVCLSVLDSIIKNFGNSLQAVIHCAGNGSVPYSIDEPLDAYQRTVGITAILLDHLRQNAPNAIVLYPSSAAVYGLASDRPLREDDTPNPVSPYGFHKLMVENLLAEHAICFGQQAVAVRFFSIYGPGLRKQLLWDASKRLLSTESPVTFFGTGKETRDWIHVEDAAELILQLVEKTLLTSSVEARLKIINGAVGERIEVRDVLRCLVDALGVRVEIRFNNTVRVGDPRFYHASVEKAYASDWRPKIAFADGLKNYATWVRTVLNNDDQFTK